MTELSIDAYLVPSEDAHSSEYVAVADERRSWLSGFSGSAGVALVTADKALLWTDGRYFTQAAAQLSEDWTLMKQYQPGVPTIEDYVHKELPSKVVGVDPMYLSAGRARDWAEKWAAAGTTLEPVLSNLIDALWVDRPEDPAKPITIHPLSLAGESVEAKLVRTREALAEAEVGAMVINALDQVGWLYNLRGSDIMCNPVFFAYVGAASKSLQSKI